MNRDTTHLLESLVERFDGTGTWTYATVPFDCAEAFGAKGKIKVIGEINGQGISATLMPHGNGTHFILLTKEIRRKASIVVGDRISARIRLDASISKIAVPRDFQNALKQAEMSQRFDKLAPSRKKAFVQWIDDAKRDETRKKRIEKSVEKISLGQPLR